MHLSPPALQKRCRFVSLLRFALSHYINIIKKYVTYYIDAVNSKAMESICIDFFSLFFRYLHTFITVSPFRIQQNRYIMLKQSEAQTSRPYDYFDLFKKQNYKKYFSTQSSSAVGLPRSVSAQRPAPKKMKTNISVNELIKES